MKDLLLRALAAALLALFGFGVGIWAAAHYFRPLLDAEQGKAARCKAAVDNLAGLAAEQGQAIGELALAAKIRQDAAELAVTKAGKSAEADFAAANRLQQERTGGDQCAAATSIINHELGL